MVFFKYYMYNPLIQECNKGHDGPGQLTWVSFSTRVHFVHRSRLIEAVFGKGQHGEQTIEIISTLDQLLKQCHWKICLY